MKTKRLHYEAPTIEVVPMEMEGVIAASVLTVDDMTPGSIGSGGSLTGSTYGSTSDFEEMINDILTFEQ